jgi:peptidoglycan/LPS O-acetylase OafA/YrhL
MTDLPPPRSPRYRSLDHWRGLACLLVVIGHSALVAVSESPVPAADRSGMEAALLFTTYFRVGVPMFFVISGYCIAATTDSTRRRSEPPSDYFRRRFRRIYPPYFAVLALQVLLMLAVDCWLVPGLLSRSVVPFRRPWTVSPWQAVGNLTLTESWRYLVIGDDRAYILNHAWTLCYEEQFYLVMGLLLLACPRRLFAGAAAITVGCLVARHALPRFGHQVPDGVFFDGQWLLFAAGILVYYRLNYAAPRARWLGDAVMVLGIPYAMRCAMPDLVMGLVFALILSWLHRWDEALASSRALRPLGFCGAICYSLYLTHSSVVRAMSQWLYNVGVRDPLATLLVTVPACTALALLVAWPFYLLVERRFLNPARGLRPPPVAVLDPAGVLAPASPEPI